MATTYSSPGVYVQEVASGSAPIAGVGTSTAGFIGVVPNTVEMAVPNPSFIAGPVSVPKEVNALIGKTLATALTLTRPERQIAAGPISAENAQLIHQLQIDTLTVEELLNVAKTSAADLTGKIVNETLTFNEANIPDLTPGSPIPRDSKTRIQAAIDPRTDLKIRTELDVASTPVEELTGKVLAQAVSIPAVNISYGADTLISAEMAEQIVALSTAGSIAVKSDTSAFLKESKPIPVAPKTVKLCTNFSEFKQFFGDFSLTSSQNQLAHGVYGFFRNGGTRCYVVRVAATGDIADVLENQFAAIDEIAIVAAPGVTDKAAVDAIVDHCKAMGDRFAIVDGPLAVTDLNSLQPGTGTLPNRSDYAALYFPWLKVYDPSTGAEKEVPPSGHIAGIYARVDTQRGVHKAPANESVLGATGLAYPLSKAKQDILNPQGVNCIRNLNGSILVWGARTWGGNANGEFKYINARRLFNYLRESIDEGTQWTVFEPNSAELWAAIRRNVSAFLTMVWRSGALFGATPEQAFYVKCDAETNPPDLRDQGQVVTEIGVALVKPAEFVIFRISQWSGDEG